MSDYISYDHEHDGIDRRGFLQCMAWAGTGLLWTVSGGVLASNPATSFHVQFKSVAGLATKVTGLI